MRAPLALSNTCISDDALSPSCLNSCWPSSGRCYFKIIQNGRRPRNSPHFDAEDDMRKFIMSKFGRQWVRRVVLTEDGKRKLLVGGTS